MEPIERVIGVSSHFLHDARRLQEDQLSWIIGLRQTSKSDIYLISTVKCNSTNWEKENDFLQSLIPCGLEICGLIIGKTISNSNDINKHLDSINIRNIFPHLLVATKSENAEDLSLFFSSNSKTISELNAPEVVEQTHFALHTQFDFPVQFSFSNDLFQESLSHHLPHLLERFEKKAFFRINEERSTLIAANNSTLETPINQFVSSKKKHISDILTCSLLLKNTNATSSSAPSPYIIYSKEPENTKAIQLLWKISALCYVPVDISVNRAILLLLESIKKTVHQIGKRQTSDPNTIYEAFYFQPDQHPHIVSAFYPTINGQVDESKLGNAREELHVRLSKKMDRPMFRIGNALEFSEKKTKSKRIRDVHAKLNLGSQISGGTQYLVDGSYDYYHYMQDSFNDNGWGCAYRSMQTICSWLKNQHYTNKEVPSHTEIQKTLVQMGDKKNNFINSTNWIGAIEIQLCLQQLYGVNSNIMHVSSGAELGHKGRELAHHFQTQGSPIMIGGGVLAYTLLGIDYNEKTGDIRFLILDPHYTGAEDLKPIKEKGWCGWKTVDLFKKDSFYNLCLPQRPHEF